MPEGRVLKFAMLTFGRSAAGSEGNRSAVFDGAFRGFEVCEVREEFEEAVAVDGWALLAQLKVVVVGFLPAGSEGKASRGAPGLAEFCRPAGELILPQLPCRAVLDLDDCCVLFFNFRTRRPLPTLTPMSALVPDAEPDGNGRDG